jgi:hypothetical protein
MGLHWWGVHGRQGVGLHRLAVAAGGGGATPARHSRGSVTNRLRRRVGSRKGGDWRGMGCHFGPVVLKSHPLKGLQDYPTLVPLIFSLFGKLGTKWD